MLNKKGYLDFLNIISVFFGATIVAIPFFLLLWNHGIITIEFPKDIELGKCQGELQACEVMKTPSCAPVEVKKDNSYWFFYVFGFAVYMGTLVYALKKSKQLDEREKELNKKSEGKK